ncbi:MAG: FkbM family methyltransferase [Chloroherpetonaceae bacterium]|nr:FkbM family methyltransferase [Chthonomonadaceae bacterium]MDW8206236.1 FkbM family methyltransferase [Chloroherpetonaceae bacterium]
MEVPILCLSDFQQILDAMAPQLGRYDWMWPLLRWRARQTGWPPRVLYPLFRRFCNPQRPYFVGRTTDGTRILGDYRDRYCVDQMVMPAAPDPVVELLIRRVQARPGIILDVGANMGMLTVALARRMPDRQILAFEPVAETARRAAATFALNQLCHVGLMIAAVGAQDGELTFYTAPGHSDYASAHPTETPLEIHWVESRVPCVTLDTLMRTGVFAQVGAIKIDVEGHEMDVLRGAQELIRQYQPDILFEYNYRIAPRIGWRPEDAGAFLVELAPYTLHRIHADGSTESFRPPDHEVGIVNLLAHV